MPGCHVGTGAADVNHDLIAAGHPRLTFELTVYQARMPRHASTNDKARYPDFEARAWAIGQVASARAALELLAAQAQPPARPWPEFAESDCFACHHDLRQPSRRIARGFGGRAPGLLPWNDWPYALLPRALPFHPTDDNARALSSLDDLRKLMSRPLPDAARVAGEARKTAAWLQLWLDGSEQGKYSDPALLLQMRAAIENDVTRAPGGWDATAQCYLGLTALYQAQRDLRPDEADVPFQALLQRLAEQLRFPEGFDSPREPDRD